MGRSTRLCAFLMAVAVLLAGCPNEAPETTVSPVPPGVSSGPAPLRLLSRREISNTVRDLTGAQEAGERAMELPPEAEVLGFDNQAEARSVDALRVDQLMAFAEDIGQMIAADPDAYLPCSPGDRTAACGRSFLQDFGSRAFRRPLSADETARYGALFDAELEASGFEDGISLLVAALLQSPHFLYRVEVGLPQTATDGHVRLSPHEMASRLSYALWATMPDDALLRAADEGHLVTEAQIAQEAQRMLDNYRSRRMLNDFLGQWLLLNRMPFVSHISLQWQMVAETERFFEEVLFDGDRSLATLLTAEWSMMNDELAEHHGLEPPDGPLDEEGFGRVDHPQDQRAGFLTHAGVLGVHARPSPEILKAPIRRGRFIREQLLCSPIAPPPADVEFPFIDPEAPEPQTAREHLAAHVSAPSCAGCHDLMDPIGLVFDGYDAQGRWRTEDERGLPIDTSGELVGTDVDGAVAGPRELASALADSEQVRACLVRQVFRFAYGRQATEADGATLDWLTEQFEASDGDVYALLLNVTATDAFLYRPEVEGGAP